MVAPTHPADAVWDRDWVNVLTSPSGDLFLSQDVVNDTLLDGGVVVVVLQDSSLTHGLQDSALTHGLQDSALTHGLQDIAFTHGLQDIALTHGLQDIALTQDSRTAP